MIFVTFTYIVQYTISDVSSRKQADPGKELIVGHYARIYTHFLFEKVQKTMIFFSLISHKSLLITLSKASPKHFLFCQ